MANRFGCLRWSGAMLISPSEADLIIAGALKSPGDEPCSLERCLGRILAEEVRAPRDQPPFDKVTVDGFALRACDGPACGGRFDIIGFAPAGSEALALSERAGTCIEVSAGAWLPVGADCVVPYERASRLQGGSTVTVEARELVRGNAFHRRGGEHRAGTILLRKGARLGATETALAASAGARELRVARRPGITLLVTGDELVERGSRAAPWQTWGSNDIALKLSLETAGFPVKNTHLLRDDEPSLEGALRAAFDRGDWLIACGGISVGRLDLLVPLAKKLGCVSLVERVEQRPGKPFCFFLCPSGQPFFALPGNPIAAFVCLHRYVLPALFLASGGKTLSTHRIRVPMTGTIPEETTQFIPVRLARDWNMAKVTLVRVNTAGGFASLVGTDGFVELAAGGGKGWGREIGVDFWPWK